MPNLASQSEITSISMFQFCGVEFLLGVGVKGLGGYG